MEHRTEQGLADYLGVLWRRKWLVLLALVLAPATALALSLSKTELFEASADVLLTGTLTGATSPLASTHVEIASSPIVARRVLRATEVTERSAGELTSAASFGMVGDADVFRISITDRDPDLAVMLANEYARQYIRYKTELSTSFITKTRQEIERRMTALEREGQINTAVYGALAAKNQELLQQEALQTSSALLLRPAAGAGQTQPTPRRDGTLGLGLGVLLAIALAFLAEAIDTRIRSGRRISELLGLPVMGRLAAPPRRLRRERRLVMLDDAGASQAEAVRMLATNLNLVNADGRYKLLLVTSATEGEGKSTTAANLAVALARMGRRVILADLDLRRPTVEKFFGLEANMGLTDVATGKLALADAIVEVPVGDHAVQAPGSTNGHGPTTFLRVLPSGRLPASPGEFVETPQLRSILDQLRGRADIVVADAPPLLDVSDALSLSVAADGVILVARIGAPRPGILRQTRDLLESIPVAKLGLVLTGAERERDYSYVPYGSYYRAHLSREHADQAGAATREE